MSQTPKQKIWNVPNALTMLRMLLIPVYWYLYMQGYAYWALAVFVTASVTDLADGYIARKYHLITDFGKLMDPLADKLMVLSLMFSFLIKGVVPLWTVVVLLSKELLMVLGGLVMLKKKIVVYSEWIGKLAQFTVVAALILCFFHEQFTALGVQIDHIVLYVGVALTLLALLFYAGRAAQRIRNLSKTEK